MSRFVGGNAIEEVYLRFAATMKHLCVAPTKKCCTQCCIRCLGKNPIRKLVATLAMLKLFQAQSIVINDPVACGRPSVDYPNLTCVKNCQQVGNFPITIVEDSAADKELYPAAKPSSADSQANAAVYISVWVFLASAVIIGAAVFLEVRRRRQKKEDEYWCTNTPGQRTTADSIELVGDLRFDPRYKGREGPWCVGAFSHVFFLRK